MSEVSHLLIADVLAQIAPADVIERLTPFVNERRRARIEHVTAKRLTSVQLAVERPYDPHNAAAIVRTADCLGVRTVHVIGAHPRVLRARHTTRGASRWVETSGHDSLGSFLTAIRRASLRLVGAVAGASQAFAELDVSAPVCVVFGSEHDGLSSECRAACDDLAHVPMVGYADSLNVSVCAALAAQSLVDRRRVHLGRDGDLDGDTLTRERAVHMLSAIDPRLIRALWPAEGSRAGAVGSDGADRASRSRAAGRRVEGAEAPDRHASQASSAQVSSPRASPPAAAAGVPVATSLDASVPQPARSLAAPCLAPDRR